MTEFSVSPFKSVQLSYFTVSLLTALVHATYCVLHSDLDSPFAVHMVSPGHRRGAEDLERAGD